MYLMTGALPNVFHAEARGHFGREPIGPRDVNTVHAVGWGHVTDPVHLEPITLNTRSVIHLLGAPTRSNANRRTPGSTP